MGTDEFCVEQEGKDAKDAFSAAAGNARYAHGHAGYTGTIAEKGSFVMLVPPERFNKSIKGRRLWVSIIDLAWERYDDSIPRWKHVAARVRANCHKRLTQSEALLAIKHYDQTEDKWGPAGCVMLKRNRWCFFGTASS